MNERFLSSLAFWATASAMTLVGLLLFFAIFVIFAVTGEFTGRTFGALVGFAGYGLVLWLLSTLPGHERSRRLASWGVSAAFHVVAGRSSCFHSLRPRCFAGSASFFLSGRRFLTDEEDDMSAVRPRVGMTMRWAYRVGALMLGLVLADPGPAAGSERIAVDGSTGVMPLVAALAKAYQERYPAAVVEMGQGLGTKARLQALAEGKIDIALASHGLVADELTRRGMAVHEIAQVAVVFGVNASVPVTSVSDRQICDIYAGRVTSWKELGGPDVAVAPRTRPDSEVDSEVVRGKIACLKDLKMADGVRVMSRSGDMAKELAGTVGAVGMTTTTVVEQSRGQIRAVSLNGVVPSAENVERKTYTLTRDSFLVTKAVPVPAVSRFVEFIRSAAGAAVIVANGAVPVR